MGASEGFQSLCSHSSDSTLPLFSLLLRVLGDLFEFEYRLDHLCHVNLDYVFHSMSLACFLLRAFILISWLETPLHFVFTRSILWDMFIHHDLLVFALYTYHEPNTSFFVWSLIQFSTQCSYCHYEKVKGTFSHLHFFRESCLDHLIIFLLRSLGWRLNKGYVVIDGVLISW